MKRLLVLLLLFAWAPPLRGQSTIESRSRTGVSVVPALLASIGSGAGSGLGVAGHLVVAPGPHRFTARLAGVADLRGFPDAGGAEHVTELALLYGRGRRGGAVAWSLSGGVASVRISDCGEGGSNRACTTVGVPVVAHAVVASRFVGIGLQLFANLNPRAPFGGIGVVVPLGWMP
ncbi:MAG: hypothetical protein R3223_08015 [Longimicrobiales bacterium]|nr:hypothetical protein [Longimicrobiales bacterium]